MKIQQLLAEQVDQQSVAQQLVEIVKSAAPFFRKRQDSDAFLWRGTKRDFSEPITVIVPRSDRRPLDSISLIHDALNAQLESDFGVPYRSAGVFAVSIPGVASEYGDPHIILPLGEFEFCWGKNVDDAILFFRPRAFLSALSLGTADSTVREKANAIDKMPPSKDRTLAELALYQSAQDDVQRIFPKWFKDLYDQAGYTTQNFVEALESQHEIMLKCERYAMINITNISPRIVEDLRSILDDSDFMTGQAFSHNNVRAIIDNIAYSLFK